MLVSSAVDASAQDDDRSRSSGRKAVDLLVDSALVAAFFLYAFVVIIVLGVVP